MENENSKKPGFNISVNVDQTPILYTDNVFMSANEDGLVFDFCQKMGPTNQMRIVARIGMSKEHGKKFAKSLEALLVSSETKLQTQTGEKTLN
ncbi:hypothetical protein COS81_00740 [candidate division WWE3 bacterium CG06_land_8_20_14_3_00_42_16]|uniref:DUF3467 domain-containing protein n=3 Tax=Katanobacteria TaxID=422282 RepID=A0A2M7APF5_UNCKA|nr:MAG: hypothetical protein COS81_00740 [candidate division WWE3 bacterium CG06_land_8_20_14_3_00_42_16]PIZ43899.1 MAG: hypothetical protein COY34_00115 [candidate division WWE3 bacterium CG_4_10_14_0_2_um_filter_42_8]PJA37109.1 MAG: hypothetical protein CO181_04935 [candidate division WWE3 bacterium CG_4_9_14_3_um_filter_43_9]